MKQKLIWGLPISGFFYLAGVLIRGHFADPAGPAGLFALKVTSALFAPAYLSILLASGFEMLGYVGLHNQLKTKLSTVAMILSIMGLHFLTAFFGVMSIAYPSIGSAYLAGMADAVSIAANFFVRPATIIVVAMASLNIVGHIIFAIELWKSSWASRMTIVAFVLAPVMQCLPMIYPVEILGCALLLVAGFLIVLSSANSPEHSPNR